jgi:hypothetical protein
MADKKRYEDPGINSGLVYIVFTDFYSFTHSEASAFTYSEALASEYNKKLQLPLNRS